MSKEMIELADEIEYCVKRGINPHLTSKAFTTIAATLRASAVAEPVVWRYRHKGSIPWVYSDKEPLGPSIHLFEVVALYAHPAPAAPVPASVREALEHVTELLVDTWADAMDGDPEREIAVADARAALASLTAPEAAPISQSPLACSICGAGIGDPCGTSPPRCRKFDGIRTLKPANSAEPEAAPTRDGGAS